MNWARKSLLHVLSLVLLMSTVGLTAALSVESVLGSPEAVEKRLDASGFYESFVNDTTAKAVQSISNSNDTAGVDRTVVQEAAQAAFGQDLLRSSVKTFLDGNYAWLEGDTTTPSFQIDLRSAKQDFAQRIGDYTQSRLTSLPACTATQLQQIQNVDPLSITCLPPGVDPATEGTRVSQQLSDSQDFLRNPLLTVADFTKNETTPYFSQVSWAPQVYQLSQMIPYILGGLAAIAAVLIFFIAPSRLRGGARIAIVVATAGVLVIVGTLASDLVFNRVKDLTRQDAAISELQDPIMRFVDQAKDDITSTARTIGIGQLAVATTVGAALWAASRTGGNRRKPTPPTPPIVTETAIDRIKKPVKRPPLIQ